MQLEWEVINGITGIVSAICSILGVGYFGTKRKSEIGTSDRMLTLPTVMAFLFSSGGWGLLCLCGLWVFEPFGSFVSSDDYLKFYGVVLALPAFMVFGFGLSTIREIRT
ncbi:membrane hypothetical protein [Vibrio nigripulchritudo MADA3029]|uniref:hypothetical protein n=1 Tax=Vibrio nigripulchritudo TaxID=28173 RepID=UPI0003B22CBA|nr:hypothetical protein [Vibrio nigripulchritudo]CCN45253.1 membrane hypothetical protein [Vibrio nigripulchritudo MADA3020]CCN53066.1 membrane hypothetical protein [Vibrio nigripulchritudo MADA3021]CCN60658.1 membrane hypothetical protein [Vibrio nigripulchritudo MADA3029]